MPIADRARADYLAQKQALDHLLDLDPGERADALATLRLDHPELAEVVARQMNELPYYNTFFGTSSTPTALLAQKVTSHAGARFNHIFFTGSGSEANDTWFRMARVYWSAVGKPSKKIVIARKNGFGSAPSRKGRMMRIGSPPW